MTRTADLQCVHNTGQVKNCSYSTRFPRQTHYRAHHLSPPQFHSHSLSAKKLYCQWLVTTKLNCHLFSTTAQHNDICFVLFIFYTTNLHRLWSVQTKRYCQRFLATNPGRSSSLSSRRTRPSKAWCLARLWPSKEVLWE